MTSFGLLINTSTSSSHGFVVIGCLDDVFDVSLDITEVWILSGKIDLEFEVVVIFDFFENEKNEEK